MEQFLELTQKDGQKTVINSLNIVYVKRELRDVKIGLNHSNCTSITVKESFNEVKALLGLPINENDRDIDEVQGWCPPGLTVR